LVMNLDEFVGNFAKIER